MDVQTAKSIWDRRGTIIILSDPPPSNNPSSPVSDALAELSHLYTRTFALRDSLPANVYSLITSSSPSALSFLLHVAL